MFTYIKKGLNLKKKQYRVELRSFFLSLVESDILVYFSILFQFVAFEMCQIHIVGKKSLFFMVIGLGCAFFDAIVKLIKKTFGNIFSYLIVFIFELLLTVSLELNIAKLENATLIAHSYFLVISYSILILIQFFSMLIALRCKLIIFKPSKYSIAVVLFFLLLTIVCNIECLNAWPRWDTFSYYNAVDNLSITNIFFNADNGLKVCGHISTVFALINILISTVLPCDLLNAMYITNFIFMFFDGLLFYGIIKRLLPHRDKWIYFLSALICMVSPYILGTSFVVNPDKLLLSSALLLFYGVVTQNNVIYLIASIIACNTKEAGVSMVAFMTFALVIKDVYLWLKEKKKIDWILYLGVLTVGILWLLQYSQVNWAESIKNDVQETFPLLDGAIFNTVTFSWLHILDTLKGEFLTNFTWLFTIFLLLAIIKKVILCIKEHHKPKLGQLITHPLFILVLGFCGYQIVPLGFVTYHFYRYYAALVAFIYISSVVAIIYLFDKAKLCRGILGIISALLFTQSFITIDFVMINSLPNISTGNSVLATLPIHMQKFSDPGFFDAANYNRQILYFDKALDKAFAAVEPDESTKIFVSSEHVLKEGLGSIFVVWGFGYQFVTPPYYGKYDTELKHRYLEKTPDNIVELDYVMPTSDLSVYNSYSDLYYIAMPWKDDTIGELMKRYPDSYLYTTINYRGWELCVYKLL